MIHDDDLPIGRLLSRREAMLLLGSAAVLALEAGIPGKAFAAARKSPCIVRPEQTEGPYFVDENLERSDIRSDPASGLICDGMPLELVIGIQRLAGKACVPLEGATVDVWHCDAAGSYSDEVDSDFDTSGKKFLRGFQRTNKDGQVKFMTIYPGWYSGRTVHIHLKVRAPGDAEAGTKGIEFTSQMYFDDFASDRVYRTAPYNSRGKRKYRNNNDVLFENGGPRLMVSLSDTGNAYRASIDYALTPV